LSIIVFILVLLTVEKKRLKKHKRSEKKATNTLQDISSVSTSSMILLEIKTALMMTRKLNLKISQAKQVVSKYKVDIVTELSIRNYTKKMKYKRK